MATIATIAAITGSGKAYAINAQGVQRELKANDTLEKGETLKTIGDVQVELLSEDMRALHINPDQVVKLDDNVFQTEQTPTAADAAVTSTATAQTIIDALDRGQDLSTTLDATAAGLGDGGGGGGATFVELGRISESVTGNSYGFDYSGLGVPPLRKAPVQPARLEMSPPPSRLIRWAATASSTATKTLKRPLSRAPWVEASRLATLSPSLSMATITRRRL